MESQKASRNGEEGEKKVNKIVTQKAVSRVQKRELALCSSSLRNARNVS